MPNSCVLVADDDAAIRTVLNQALSRAGYEVRITSNAATLWRWVAAGEGDLVVTAGQLKLKEGAAVRPVGEGAPAPAVQTPGMAGGAGMAAAK